MNPPILVGYIDPGSGAMLLQWVIALVLGAGIFFRNFIARMFRRLTGRKDPDANSAGGQEPES